MPGKRRKETAEYRGEQDKGQPASDAGEKKKGTRGIPRGTGQRNSAGLINEGKNREKMKVELIIPIEGLHGKLRRDGYYFRKYRGQQIVQKCPNREGHVKTEAEASNQRRFAEKYAGSHRQVNNPKQDPDAG